MQGYVKAIGECFGEALGNLFRVAVGAAWANFVAACNRVPSFVCPFNACHGQISCIAELVKGVAFLDFFAVFIISANVLAEVAQPCAKGV